MVAILQARTTDEIGVHNLFFYICGASQHIALPGKTIHDPEAYWETVYRNCERARSIYIWPIVVQYSARQRCIRMQLYDWCSYSCCSFEFKIYAPAATSYTANTACWLAIGLYRPRSYSPTVGNCCSYGRSHVSTLSLLQRFPTFCIGRPQKIFHEEPRPHLLKYKKYPKHT